MLKLKLLGLGMFLLLGVGCARMPSISIPNPLELVAGPSTIHVEVATRAGAIPLLRGGQPVSLAVANFTDARPGTPGRKIGNIKATVSNMHGTELTLDQDVAALLGSAVRGQLAADGFRVVNAVEAADFKLGAVAKVVSLNIAGTDELAIVAEVTLRDGKSGDVVWAGEVSEKADRYAGVSGNSRATIIEYLGDGVAAFSGKLSAVVRDGLARSYPRSMTVSQHKPVSSIPGVTTAQAAASRETLPVAASTGAPSSAAATVPIVAATAPRTAPAPSPAPSSVANIGHLSVSSLPARAKVYVEDVYYGMTPLKLELPVGVSLMRFKLDGYKPASEKVAIRRGETTELEIKFQK